MAAIIFLTILAVVMFMPHITHGGLYYDDWASVSLARSDTHGLFGFLLPSWTNPGNRPLHNVIYSLALAVLGDHQHAFPAYTALITLGVSLALYAALRVLCIERIHAVLIAGLAIVYPLADSTHLWFSAMDSDGTLIFYLLGVTVAIRGLSKRGASTVFYHAVAVALFACSIMLYESTASVIALTGFLYLQSSRRRCALMCWSADIACTLLLLLLFASNSNLPRTEGVSALVHHAQTIYGQFLTLLAWTVAPLNIDRTAVLVGIAIVLLSGGIAYWRLSNNDHMRHYLRRWLLLAIGGLVFAAAAVAMFIPAASYYVPLQEGIGNRVNAVPAVGLVCTAYALYMIIGSLVGLVVQEMRRRTTNVPPANRFSQRLGVALGIVLVLLTGVRLAHLQRADISAWDLASRYQLNTLESVQAVAPHIAQNRILLVFGGPAYTRPGVPVFAASWDLNGAIQLTYNDFTLAAYPILSGNSLTCTPTGIVPTPEQGLPSLFPYDRVVLIDTATREVIRPSRQSQCAKALPVFTPGPETLLPSASL